MTGALTYVPLLVIDPDIVFRRVLSYQGLGILTSAGVRIWGLQNFLYLTGALPGAWQQQNFNGHPQCAVLSSPSRRSCFCGGRCATNRAGSSGSASEWRPDSGSWGSSSD
jgi:hypothetical protein